MHERKNKSSQYSPKEFYFGGFHIINPFVLILIRINPIRSISCPCFSLPLTAWWKATKNIYIATSVKDGKKLASCSLLFYYFSIERRIQQRLSLTKILWNVSHFLSRRGGGENLGGVTWFSGGMEGNLVVSSRVQRRHYEKLNAN